MPDHAHKAFVPYQNLFGTPAPPAAVAPKTHGVAPAVIEPIPSTRQSAVVHASVVRIQEGFVEIDRDLEPHEALDGAEADALADHLENLGLDDDVASSSRRIPWDYLVYVSVISLELRWKGEKGMELTDSLA